MKIKNKWCFWCDTRKDIKDFYRAKSSEDGYGVKCKLCYKEYQRKNKSRINERKKELKKRYPRRYILTEHSRKLRQKAVERYRKKNPENFKAYTAVYYAVKTGKMDRGECEFCDTENITQGHHEDYGKPLDVMWLCIGCHNKWHIAKKIIENNNGSTFERNLNSGKKISPGNRTVPRGDSFFGGISG